MIHFFSFPTRIHFGFNARALVADHLRRMHLTRPLIVTDRGAAGLPAFTTFRGSLGKEAALGQFSEIAGAATAAQVAACAIAIRSHHADSVIGFGGDAALDVAKAASLMSVHEGAILDYALGPAAPRPVLATPPHLIAVPNFSGGGAAVSRECVICEDRSLARRVIDADALLPRAAFVDPELTMGHTPNLTLAAGMDVLSRNIEAYLSTLYHPMCESIALEGAALANRALQALALPPDNPEARADLMMASLLGAIAQQKGLGATRSCARALGAVCGLHDGLANALMLEPVMNFNAEALPERIERIALAMRANCAEDFVPYLRRLKRQIGVTGRLSLYGVRPDQIAELAAQAKADPAHRTNPRPCDLEDFVAFFEAAM